jgi:hypothetical protein
MHQQFLSVRRLNGDAPEPQVFIREFRDVLRKGFENFTVSLPLKRSFIKKTLIGYIPLGEPQLHYF